MRLHRKSAEGYLKDLFSAIEKDPKLWRAVHLAFHAQLTDASFQARTNILEAFFSDWFAREEGHVFFSAGWRCDSAVSGDDRQNCIPS